MPIRTPDQIVWRVSGAALTAAGVAAAAACFGGDAPLSAANYD
ncbi:MAG: hypothetical protein ACXW61_00370 [Gemmatirosa sp.]